MCKFANEKRYTPHAASCTQIQIQLKANALLPFAYCLLPFEIIYQAG